MTYEDVAKMIESVGVPYAYYQFPEDTAEPPPFICFYYDSDDGFIADDINYVKVKSLTIELYTDNKDFALEEKLETALNGCGFPFARVESYIDTEKLYLNTYTTEVIIDG